jgi:lipopolysaccharide export system protein LptA
MWNWFNSAVVVFTILATVVPAGAAPEPSRTPEDRTTTITSQKMTVRNAENKAVFEGAVVLVKGALTVHSDVMVVFFKAQDSAAAAAKPEAAREKPAGAQAGAKGGNREELPTLGNKSVSMIEATGKVVTIEKSEGRATCRKAVYFGDEDKLVLTGDPVAWEKGTRVAGNKITMYLAEDRSVVEGGSRVRIEQ